LTHAQAAALEAYEEAGVHGRIEEASFARYVARKRSSGGSSARSRKELAVNAHLCEVLRLGPPEESNRNRTWFSPEEAKRRLREGRGDNEAAQFTRIVDKAVAHIHQLQEAAAPVEVPSNGDLARRDQPHQYAQRDPAHTDALRKVQFDFAEACAPMQASLMPYTHALGTWRQSAPPAPGRRRPETLVAEVLRFESPSSPAKKPHALGSGARNNG
jgi:hypothetical protein